MQYSRRPLWYKDAIIYELNIKGFYDSNADGIGDFEGLRQKLDYLEDLGVTAIWLLPFYPSPLRDDGYDIQDYYTVSSPYGNIDDFKAFLEEAHQRGLQVITELVINHTSDQHPWFQRARRAPKGSPERDYYVWSDTDDKYKDVRIIFTDTEISNWTWDPVAQQYYWHRFFHHQPDLNYDNLQVQEEIFRILEFWMDMGIDGFRLDAIPYLFEREGTNGENLPETHVFLKKLRKHVDDRYENVLFLAEANMWPEDSASYFGDGDECHMNYHFPLMPRMYMSVKMENRHPITDIFDQTPAIPENCQWATFLRNHDELTLEMVTDEERDFMYQVYAKDRTARINLGIRRRLAPLMDNDRSKIELLNVLLLSLPGTPVLYYGDEIGMGDNYYLGDRDGVRTPMQWDNNENAGFSEANPHQLYLPIVRDTEYGYRSVNVKRQLRNQNSLLWWTKRVLAKRKEFQVFGRGDIQFLNPDNGKILAFIREYEGEIILVVINLSRYPEAVQLDLADYEGARVKEVFGGHDFPEVGRGYYPLTVGAYGYYWLELITQRQDTRDYRRLDGPQLRINKVEALANKAPQRTLNRKTLPDYLRSVHWGGSRITRLDNVEIVDIQFVRDEDRVYPWLFFEVRYKDGLPELLQLPLVLLPEPEGQDLSARFEVLARVTVDGHPMLLTDALYDDEFLHHLSRGCVGLFADHRDLTVDLNTDFSDLPRQVFSREYATPDYQNLASRDLAIKFYRRMDTQDTPDLEVRKLLEARAFANTARLLGSAHYQPDRKTNATIAIYESRLSMQGSAWQYVLDNLSRYTESVILSMDDPNAPQNGEKVELLDTIRYVEMPTRVREHLDSTFVSRLAGLGRTVAAYHRLLSEADTAGFGSEPLSLHYQRSLFAGLKGRVRETMTLLKRLIPDLPEADQAQAKQLRESEGEILNKIKQVFDHKIEADKIRTHGDLTLEQFALTGDEFTFLNFDGDPEFPYSQRRLRRSAVKDLANLLRSLHYAARTAERQFGHLREDRQSELRLRTELVYRCLAAEFLTAYRKAVAGTRLLPDNDADLKRLLDTFLLEKGLQEVRYDLQNRPDQAIIPIQAVLEMLE